MTDLSDAYPLPILAAPRRNSKHWTPGTITWGELAAWCDDPASKKECGSYVLGEFAPVLCDCDKCMRTETRYLRNKTTVRTRAALTLDVDTPGADFKDIVELLLPSAAILHTTYSSSPDDLRYRLIVPLSRHVAPDEYHQAASVMMERLGVERFDPGSVQPERYMFKPAAQEPGWFDYLVLTGPPADADELLADFDPDLSKLPAPRVHKNKRNPFEIEGVIGAFNTAYEDFNVLMESYELPYEAEDDGARWHLVGARSVGGLSLVADGLVFSHHVTDPAYERTCSAFDLVRLHRYGHLDAEVKDGTPVNRLPSHKAMLSDASTDHRVVAQLVGVDFDEELDDLDWKMNLRFTPQSAQLVDDMGNWDLITSKDEVFKALYYDELAMAVCASTDLPWRPLDRGGVVFSGIDRSALCLYLERTYRIRPARGFVDELIDTTAHQRYTNPVRDYLTALKWDGTPRVERALPGVSDTPYNRLVARKALTAAAARMLEPGIKWDHTLVLFGVEGLGKTHWIERMSRGHSASLGRIGDKDTLLALHRSWIMVADEGYSLRKADADVQKEFLTRTEDVFRAPFEKETLAHKRRCVIWGSTNDEIFLRRQEGNRRFLIVHCEEAVNFDDITPEYVDQVWAEAVHLFRSGELLFLTSAESGAAAAERERFTEEDALAGVLEEYLDTLVPEGWAEWSPDERIRWREARADGMGAPGTEPINETCTVQLWVEAMGRRFGDHRRADLLEIGAALKQIPGWRLRPGRYRFPHYGPQQVFERLQSIDEQLADIL